MSEKNNSLSKINLVYRSKNSNNNQEIKNNLEDLNNISKKKISKKMITYKNIQNLDLATYDYIFINRQILNSTIHDFNSFEKLIEDLEKQFKPEVLYSNDINEIKKEGKFSLNKYNITNLISFNEKNIELSINTKYVHCRNIKFKSSQK